MRPLPETAAGFLFSGFDGDLVGAWRGFGGLGALASASASVLTLTLALNCASDLGFNFWEEVSMVGWIIGFLARS